MPKHHPYITPNYTQISPKLPPNDFYKFWGLAPGRFIFIATRQYEDYSQDDGHSKAYPHLCMSQLEPSNDMFYTHHEFSVDLREATREYVPSPSIMQRSIKWINNILQVPGQVLRTSFDF